MRCTECGNPMFVTNEQKEAVCYTCFVCPAHFYGTDLLAESYALVLPLAGSPCPGCRVLIPFEPDELRRAFEEKK